MTKGENAKVEKCQLSLCGLEVAGQRHCEDRSKQGGDEEGRKRELLSLYAGCGGLDLGFEQSGFSVGLAYDIRASAVASWNGNRPEGAKGRVADLTSIRIGDIDMDYGGEFIPAGVIGGPPCQSFSRANHYRRDDDPRGDQINVFFSIALEFHRKRRPLDFVLMENVPELAKEGNRKRLDREKNRLKRHGFRVFEFFVDAVRHGVPQYRSRLFVLAIPRADEGSKRWLEPKGSDTKRTVRQAIGTLPPPVRFQRGLTKGDIPEHPNHWCMNPKSPRFFDGSLEAGSTSWRSFKTLDWDSPSVTASYGHREVHVHPDGCRRLSVYEAMRIQGFPRSYVLEGNLSEQISQVSEAVPPPLARAVASAIAEAVAT